MTRCTSRGRGFQFAPRGTHPDYRFERRKSVHAEYTCLSISPQGSLREVTCAWPRRGEHDEAPGALPRHHSVARSIPRARSGPVARVSFRRRSSRCARCWPAVASDLLGTRKAQAVIYVSMSATWIIVVRSLRRLARAGRGAEGSTTLAKRWHPKAARRCGSSDEELSARDLLGDADARQGKK